MQYCYRVTKLFPAKLLILNANNMVTVSNSINIKDNIYIYIHRI